MVQNNQTTAEDLRAAKLEHLSLKIAKLRRQLKAERADPLRNIVNLSIEAVRDPDDEPMTSCGWTEVSEGVEFAVTVTVTRI